MTSFPIVDCAGAPFELGASAGRALAGRAQRAWSLYAGWFERMGLGGPGLLQAGERVLAVIREVRPERALELAGLAEGAGLTPAQVAVLNARSELLSTHAPGLLAECTSVGLQPQATRLGRPLLAQTWDWFAPFAKVAALVRARPSDGPGYLTFCEAGQLAKVGVNAAGLAVGLNFLDLPARERSLARRGLPVHLLAREVLGCHSVGEALRLLQELPRGGACNLLLADRSGEVVDVEVLPSRLDLIWPEAGVVTHANELEARLPRSARRPVRSAHARELAGAGAFSAATLFGLLQSHGPRGEPICAHGDPRDPWASSASVAGLVYAPAGDETGGSPALWVSGGPPCTQRPTRVAAPGPERPGSIRAPTQERQR